MTERLYQKDSYLRDFEGQVVRVEPDGVVLDRTVFFPSGGGVMGDQGFLTAADGTKYQVVETLDMEGEVFHKLDKPGLQAGDSVKGALDWERRYILMRYHTATHVLTGVMFKDYNVRVTGNQLTPEKGRVDFSFETYDKAVLEEGFQKSNDLVAKNLPVEISFLPASEAKARPELFKLETGFRHDLDELRLVDIVGFDVQADGGCHVAHLKEVGSLTMTKAENKGKSNRRVYFVLD